MPKQAERALPANLSRESLSHLQKNKTRSYTIIIVALFILTLVLILLEISCGVSGFKPLEKIQALFGIGTAQSINSVQAIRMPRAMCAVVSGAGLAIAGAALQSVLENPLASSSTIGISQGAAFGATAGILAIAPWLMPFAPEVSLSLIALCAFIGAMSSSVVVLLFSKLGIDRPESIILVGVALSALWAGASTLFQYFANDIDLAKVIFWHFGDLGRATWLHIKIMALVAIISIIYFLKNRWNYNALQNGALTAKSLGVSVKKLRLTTVFIASLCAACIVAFVGLINFIGLIAPHIARKLVGCNYCFLLPASAMLGSALMLASDIAARMIISPIILPIGAITSFLGAPLFLYLLYKGVKE